MELTENAITEFKREYTDNIKKTIVAFANSGGGTIYIGIEDDGTVAGVKNVDATLLKITSSVHESIKPDVTMFINYKTQKMKNKAVIAVDVQKGTAGPYYLAGKGIRPEGVFVRHGASTVSASEAVILKMIKEAGGENYEEIRSINQNLTFSETEFFFNQKKILFTRNHRKSLKLTTNDGIYTNLGFLLSDQCSHTVKLAVFEGFEKEIFRDRREFSGSLLRQLDEVNSFIDMYNHTHSKVEGLFRVDTRDYPQDAIREALLNALVHRDYSYSGSTLVSIFDDRIEFVSIGGLVKGISIEDIQLGVSFLRNENLANIFYRLELIEAYGTGIPKIFRRYSNSSNKPKIEATGNAFKITLPNINSVSHIPSKQPDLPLSENEEVILKILEGKKTIIRKDAESALSVSQAMAARVLKGMVDKGLLLVSGKGRQTRYSAQS
jgi:ATP-dependent DNA helicase RecG